MEVEKRRRLGLPREVLEQAAVQPGDRVYVQVRRDGRGRWRPGCGRGSGGRLPLEAALMVATGQVPGVQEIVTTNGRLAEVDGRVRVLGR